jgi:hypothetical protein
VEGGFVADGELVESRSDGAVNTKLSGSPGSARCAASSSTTNRGNPTVRRLARVLGGPLRVTGFRARVWRPATRAAGVDGLRIHDLRHTGVALWIAAGANPKEVAGMPR